ncbi:MAG: hypothetical protein SOZ87_02415 [Candidatus Cryptobacteroides sp.]|jgi:hypothetical protein|nr:hypothetical protein [Candidatus Cryptobacteroides sp.]
MERISMYNRTSAKGDTLRVRLRLIDGRDVTLYHKTGIRAKIKDLEKFTPEGTLKPKVTVYNKQLKAELNTHFTAMSKAYALMKAKGMDMTSDVLEKEIDKILNPVVEVRSSSAETLCERFVRFADESRRDGIIGVERYKMIVGQADKLKRFLTIKGLSKISVTEFDTNLLLEYRQFVFDEYLYVEKYPKLYKVEKKRGARRNPAHRASINTVVNTMKNLQALFNELEKTDEIMKSPFRRLTTEKKRAVMHTMYDSPVFLRQEEFQKVIDTEVPDKLQGIKDAFILNCCFGCRIGDFSRLSMEKVSVSPEGIPYIHYIPSKTSGTQETNKEIVTPLIRLAYDIIQRTRFDFGFKITTAGTSFYNKKVRDLIKACGIDRKVSIYDQEKHDNVYIPLYEEASSKLARKTHVDMMSKVQVNLYAAGLHREGSSAVNRYTNMELKDHFALMNVAFGQKAYKVDQDLNIIEEGE